MKIKLILAFLFIAAALFGQQTVTLCYSSGASPHCQTYATGTVNIITLDMRTSTAQPVPVMVVQPLPSYQVAAMQSYVTGQVYNLQQPDGSFVMKSRYSSIQDLLMQYIIRSIGIPALQLYPQTGNTNTTYPLVMADLAASVQIIPILPGQ